ncbi:hypothetical protein ACTXT7_011848, partial [Hymenolepis weldensis]
RIKALEQIAHFLAKESSATPVAESKTSSKKVRKGNKNHKKNKADIRDSLSRCISLEKDVCCILADSIRNIPVTVAEINHAPAKDSVIRKVLTTK